MGLGYVLSQVGCDFLMLVYPFYKTFKALKNERDEEYRQWLMFWAVVGVFSIFESYIEWTVSWLPFFYELKLLFVLWLAAPQSQGAVSLYSRLLHPFLIEREEQIDNKIDETVDIARANSGNLARKGMSWVQQNSAKALQMASGMIAKENAAGLLQYAVNNAIGTGAPAESPAEEEQSKMKASISEIKEDRSTPLSRALAQAAEAEARAAAAEHSAEQARRKASEEAAAAREARLRASYGEASPRPRTRLQNMSPQSAALASGDSSPAARFHYNTRSRSSPNKSSDSDYYESDPVETQPQEKPTYRRRRAA
eukprot:TRINITY_DN32994_c0_g1_i2.p1 TRINITY_DN32994_c0_g1~~TRINITY_DN32994_c0_g1_i2.p1  ORF type:complete len:311 (-),score=56.04 TRINITY_DN32994_c0_g1_i2:34-966(-)